MPPVYRKSRENQTISYDYVDIQSGIGIVKFGLMATNNGVTPTPNYIMSKDEVYGDPVSVSATSTTNDYDFYTEPLTLPQLIKGNVKIDCTISNHSSTGSYPSGYVTFSLYKVDTDGSTLTLLGTERTKLIPSSGAGIVSSTAVDFDVAKTLIAAGEGLMMRAAVTSSGGSSANHTALSIDPKNRSQLTNPTVTAHTNTNVYIPFDLDL